MLECTFVGFFDVYLYENDETGFIESFLDKLELIGS